MLLKKCISCLLLASGTAVVASSAAQHASAALIGIARYFGPQDAARPLDAQLGIEYHTVLIVFDGSKASVQATLPDVIVPHGQDWWRVGVKFDCQVESARDFTGDDREKGDIHKWSERLYSSRIEQAPQVLPSRFGPGSGTCSDQTIADFKRAIDSRQTAQFSDWEPFQPCIYSAVAITGVTPDFVSTREHDGNSSECETTGFSWNDAASTRRIDDPKPVQYSELFGYEGWEEYNRTLVAAGKDLAAHGMNCELSEDDLNSEDPRDTHDTGWYLQRRKGKWGAMAMLQLGNAVCQYESPLPRVLPAELVGYDRLRPGWAALSRQLEGLEDAFTSPSGDLAVAVYPTQIETYALQGQRADNQLLALPGDRVVMVQWAEGKYVDAWERELKFWQRRGLPTPVVNPNLTEDQ